MSRQAMSRVAAVSAVSAVLAVTALGVSGCSGGGAAKSSGSSGSSGLIGGSSAGKAGDADAPGGSSLSGQVPPGFSNATAWSTSVDWADSGIGKPTLGSEDQGVSNLVVAQQQGTLGVARTVGTSVVVPSFSPGGAAGPVVATLKFLDAKTGKPIAEKKLPAGTFLGLASDVAAGKPVAVVRYQSGQNDQSPVVVVFDASGAQVWSSQDQQAVGDQPPSTGDQDGDGAAFMGGYTLRLNDGKDTSDHTDSSYDVLDIGGKSVLHVPMYADKWDTNSVDIVQGYAVVLYDDSLSQSDTSLSKEHFTVYDLAAGGKKVGEVAEKDSGGMADAAGAVAAGGKVMMTWLDHTGGGSTAPNMMTVLDTATGQTTAPAPIPVGVGGYRTLIDPATSNVLFYDDSDVPNSGSIMVSLAKGTVLWTQNDGHKALIPLSLHNGVVYGIEPAQLGFTDARQLAVKEADGTPAGTDYDLSPLDFTADGAPLFAEADTDVETGGSTVMVGVGRGA